jgi:hypothetical protein
MDAINLSNAELSAHRQYNHWLYGCYAGGIDPTDERKAEMRRTINHMWGLP